MRAPLIHIGYHKTGSTWLQQELFVRGHSVFEPFSFTDLGHSTLAKHFILGPEGYLLSPFDDNCIEINKQIELIKRKFPDVSHVSKIPVLSSERLSGNPNCSGFDSKSIAKRLRKIFSSAKILIVIREQTSFLLSNYFQYLSDGGIHGLKKYLSIHYDGRRPYFSPNYIDYLPLIKYYSHLFGKENVTVLPFEMFRDEPDKFIHHLGSALNVHLSVDNNKYVTKRNIQYNLTGKYYLRILNSCIRSGSLNDYSELANPLSRRLASGLISALSWILGSNGENNLKAQLDKNIQGWTKDRYTIPNARLSDFIGLDLALYGYKSG